MKKAILFLSLIFIFLAIALPIIAQDDDDYIPFGYVLKTPKDITDRDYYLGDYIDENYPFDIDCEFMAQTKEQQYVLYENKDYALFMGYIPKSPPTYYLDADGLTFSWYMNDQSLKFQSRVKAINFIENKMHTIKCLKEKEYITLYNLVKSGKKSAEITRLVKLNDDRITLYVKTVYNNRNKSAAVKKRYDLLNASGNKKLDLFAYLAELKTYDDSNIGLSTNTKGNDVLYQLTLLEGIMNESSVTSGDLYNKEREDFNDYLKKYRTPVDEKIVNAMAEAIKQRKQKLKPNQKEEDYDISNEVVAILDKGDKRGHYDE